MISVGIAGATGYAGAELVRILSGHPEIKLTALCSRSHAGTKFDKIYPSFKGIVETECEEFDTEVLCGKTDVIFTSLPHKIPMKHIPEFIKKGKKVIDLSADFRFTDPANYEAAYQEHTAKELLKEAVYGLCEVYPESIKAAALIGNPGCYPTSILLPLIPLIKNKLIITDTIIADSKSGVSGAGRGASLTSLFCEVTESFKPYKVAVHRHNPEINEVLSIEAGNKVNVTFVPHLVPMSRGMLSTIYAQSAEGISGKEIQDCLNSFYADKTFIRLCSDNSIPDTRNVIGTNFCDIGFKIESSNGRIILMSAIDNLVKGAAGQAVQNMNIMLGFKETTGLLNTPYPL